MAHYRSNTDLHEAHGIALGDLLGALLWLAIYWWLR
jgi:hypothetical protein